MNLNGANYACRCHLESAAPAYVGQHETSPRRYRRPHTKQGRCRSFRRVDCDPPHRHRRPSHGRRRPRCSMKRQNSIHLAAFTECKQSSNSCCCCWTAARQHGPRATTGNGPSSTCWSCSLIYSERCRVVSSRSFIRSERSAQSSLFSLEIFQNRNCERKLAPPIIRHVYVINARKRTRLGNWTLRLRDTARWIRAIQTTFKDISVWRGCSALVTFWFQCAVYKSIYSLTHSQKERRRCLGYTVDMLNCCWPTDVTSKWWLSILRELYAIIERHA